MSTDLVSWLRAQLDADEKIARAADAGSRWAASVTGSSPDVSIGDEVAWSREVDYAVWRCEDEQDGCPEIARGYIAEARHIAANDPAHVLRTVAAHRAILDRHGPGVSHPDECGRCNDPWPCGDALSIAAIFEGRDGWDPSWKVET